MTRNSGAAQLAAAAGARGGLHAIRLARHRRPLPELNEAPAPAETGPPRRSLRCRARRRQQSRTRHRVIAKLAQARVEATGGSTAARYEFAERDLDQLEPGDQPGSSIAARGDPEVVPIASASIENLLERGGKPAARRANSRACS